MTEAPKRGRTRFLFLTAILMFVFLAQALAFLDANSQTSDEAVHLVAGYSYLTRLDFRLNSEHPPLIKELAALSVYLRYRLPFDPDPALWEAAEQWFLGLNFLYRSPVPADAILSAARLPNVLLGMVLVGLVGWWAYRLWGPWSGVLAAALAAFDPNLVAHASLVTTDLGMSLFLFLTLYLAWEHARLPSAWKLVSVGIAVGLALGTKFSSILLPLILFVVLAAHAINGGMFRLPSGRGAVPIIRSRVGEAGACWLLVLVLAATVVPVIYLFQDFGAWWKGASTVLAHQGLGHKAFFLGQHSDVGWWSYFLVAFLIKTPIGSLLLILTALVLANRGTRLTRQDGIFLLLTPLILFAAASYGRINIGLRHILPIYPFLYVFASRLATLRPARGPWQPVLLGLPLALTAASSLRAAPHQLAYFNEAVGGPGQGARYLSDSNIDWGQDLRGLARWVRAQGNPMIYLSYFGNVPPEIYGLRYQYVPAYGYLVRPGLDLVPEEAERELLAISVYNLQGVHFADHDLYAWLHDREPIAKIGYSIYVFDITGDAESHLRIAQAYMKEGPWELAVPELRKVLRLDPANEHAALMLSFLSQVPVNYRHQPGVPPLPDEDGRVPPS